MSDVDTTEWSGEGAFTQTLIEVIAPIADVAFLRVEDALATRVDAGYQLISNELYVAFRTESVQMRTRRFGFWPTTVSVRQKQMSLDDLARALTDADEVGEPDYGDDGMMQYLRTERVVPPYQTRGYKLVEMVRIYEVADLASPAGVTR
ncbi:MAG: hypothetical protein QF463_01260 [Vicinamibacterales bacterium]|nr:hypothetical protein [Acidobacteriota bacterium]MDP6371392.1 hypothetical protein [Vicinamibacterales bacterium]MDP6607676.1 hypothetical protein [Vicinamibacterales bacterium]HAK56538.1 hypothetical protein [Acidobacteriota bacterium]